MVGKEDSDKDKPQPKIIKLSANMDLKEYFSKGLVKAIRPAPKGRTTILVSSSPPKKHKS